MSRDELVLHVEAALLSVGRPVAVDELLAMFEGRDDAPDRGAVREAVAEVAEHWRGRSLEVAEVASGFRAQVRKEYSQALPALWQQRPARYSRALLETLALIAYRQPVSRGEIEEVRGVSVSSSIMRTLIEREWVRVVGHREAPGRPALYGTTRHFLDAFNLKSLESLPPLAKLRDLDEPLPDLFGGIPGEPAAGEGEETPGADAAGGAAPDRTAAAQDSTSQPDPGGVEADRTAAVHDPASQPDLGGVEAAAATASVSPARPDSGEGETDPGEVEEMRGAAAASDPPPRGDHEAGDGGRAG